MISELLFNIKSFAEQYFLLTSTDKVNFKNYIKKFKYSNGVIEYDKNHVPVTNFLTYNHGVLDGDKSKKVSLYQGVLKNDGGVSMSAGAGTLTIS